MVWKPREKEVTREEAIAQAKKDLAPIWFNSQPLLAALNAGGQWQAFPLDPSFEKLNWLVIVKDPTHPSALIDVPLLLEFHKRYGDYGLNILYLQQSHYSYLREREYLDQQFRRGKLPWISVLDQEGRYARSFNAPGPVYGSETRAVLLAQRQIEIERTGPDWYRDTEQAIQLLLRKKDPGLPLPPPVDSLDKLRTELARIDFGRYAPAIAPSLAFEMSGAWWVEGDRLVTNDPHAWLKMKSPSSRLAVYAQAISKVSNIARIGIELAGAPAPVSVAGADLKVDDEGGVALRLDEPRLYQAVVDVPPTMRDVTLRFPSADRASIAIYGICFWE